MTSPGGDTRHIVGCMTGTSIDAIDAALVEVRGRGLDISARFVDAIARPLGTLAPDLRRLASQEPLPASRIAQLMWEFGELHADVIAQLVKRSSPPTLDLICIHGQTVFHGGGRSWQLIQPAPITQRIKSPVVFDLRAADIAAGGQGAPITPLADWILFRSPQRSRAIVNLGGFCNFTLLPALAASPDPSGIRGRDLCACNQLLDGLARIRLGRKFDEDGAAASSGSPIPTAIAGLMQILTHQSAAGRSLGTGDELSSWISATATYPAADVVRSACEAIAQTIARAIDADETILAGGGAKNQALLTAIRSATRAKRGSEPTVYLTDELGIPAAYREATEFAILGALCQDRTPITLPAVTGCPTPAPISGAWMHP